MVRTALALSALTGKECRVSSIRSRRKNPGLQHQHLETARAVQQMCNAKTEGLEIGSTEIVFCPRKVEPRDMEIRIPTAGSIALVLQSVMLASFGHEMKISFKGGGSHGLWAPPLTYTKNILLPLLMKFGLQGRIDIDKYGYYPSGGAEVRAVMGSSAINPVIMENRSRLLDVRGISHASSFLEKREVAKRQAEAAARAIKMMLGVDAKIDVIYSHTDSPGSSIQLEAVFENTVIGANALGEKGKSSQSVGLEAAHSLSKAVGSATAVDEYAQDQLLPYMALAPESRIMAGDLTKHSNTNIWVIEKFLPVKFDIDGPLIFSRAL